MLPTRTVEQMLAVHAQRLQPQPEALAPATSSVDAAEAQGEMCLMYMNRLEEKVAMLEDLENDARRRLAEREDELLAVKDKLAQAQRHMQEQAQELWKERHEHEKTKLLAAKQEEMDRHELGYLSLMHEGLERQLAEMQERLILEVERRAKSDALARVAEDALDIQLSASLAADSAQRSPCKNVDEITPRWLQREEIWAQQCAALESEKSACFVQSPGPLTPSNPASSNGTEEPGSSRGLPQKSVQQEHWDQLKQECWALKEQIRLLEGENASLRDLKNRPLAAIETRQDAGTEEAVWCWVDEKDRLLTKVQTENMALKLERTGLASDRAATQKALETLAVELEVATARTRQLELTLQDAMDSIAKKPVDAALTQEQLSQEMKALRTTLGDRDAQVKELESLLKSEREEAGRRRQSDEAILRCREAELEATRQMHMVEEAARHEAMAQGRRVAQELEQLKAENTREIESRDSRIKQLESRSGDAATMRWKELLLQAQEQKRVQSGAVHNPLLEANAGTSSRAAGKEAQGIGADALGQLDHVATPPPGTPHADTPQRGRRERVRYPMRDVTPLQQSRMNAITPTSTRGVSALWSEDGKRRPVSTITVGDSARREQNRLYRRLPRSRSLEHSLSRTPSPTTSDSSPDLSPVDVAATSLSPRRPVRPSLLLSRMSVVSPFAIRNREDRVTPLSSPSKGAAIRAAKPPRPSA